jgi:hypothetical protein
MVGCAITLDLEHDASTSFKVIIIDTPAYRVLINQKNGLSRKPL